jgi:ribosomal protein L16 Arg81 hydroxylase
MTSLAYRKWASLSKHPLGTLTVGLVCRPINVEHVDLDRFPLFKQAPQQTGTVQKGDLLYIPSHWWHHIRSHRRNIMVALHFSPYGSVFFKYVMNFWPDRLKMRHRLPPCEPGF